MFFNQINYVPIPKDGIFKYLNTFYLKPYVKPSPSKARDPESYAFRVAMAMLQESAEGERERERERILRL